MVASAARRRAVEKWQTPPTGRREHHAEPAGTPYSVREAAALLGVSQDAIEANYKQLDGFRIGRRILIPRASSMAWWAPRPGVRRRARPRSDARATARARTGAPSAAWPGGAGEGGAGRPRRPTRLSRRLRAAGARGQARRPKWWAARARRDTRGVPAGPSGTPKSPPVTDVTDGCVRAPEPYHRGRIPAGAPRSVAAGGGRPRVRHWRRAVATRRRRRTTEVHR